MARPLHIACLQTRPMPSFETALAEAMPLAEQAVAAGAQMLFLPEYCGGLAADGPRLTPPLATETTHPVLAALRELARDRRVWVMVGSLAIDTGGRRFANRGLLLSDTGAIVGRYDKLHLFDAALGDGRIYRESDTVAPGTAAVVHTAGPATLGHTICYDLRFPALYRTLAQAGAEILTCPAAFTAETGAAHWAVLVRARAIETTRFVVAPDATGPVPGGGACHGHSMIVDPWGQVLAKAGTDPCVLTARIDLDQIDTTAARLPSLSHDRGFATAAPDHRIHA